MSTIQAYAFERPTHEGLLASLGQVMPMPQVESVVVRAQRELQLSGLELEQLEPRQLLRVAQHLTRERGLVSIVSRSFAIRLESHWELARTEHWA